MARTGRRAIGVAAVTGAVLVAGLVPASGRSSVVISGHAYAFIFAGNNDRLEGATIRIAEFPDLRTTAGANGAYALEVPNNAVVTPYVEFPGYYPTHIQTFTTSGQDLRNVNFQVPEMGTYKALAAITGAKVDPQTGLLAKCAIVSTFFEVKGRTFEDFDEFHDFHPHGVPGATATQRPSSGRQLYFNKDVIPDPNQKESSRDGGVLWADVDTGTYDVTARKAGTRFGSFRATCAPGRLVNANPPWGLYQLAINENVNPAVLPDRTVAAWVTGTRIRARGPQRRLIVRLKTHETVTTEVSASQRGGAATTYPPRTVTRSGSLRFPLSRKVRAGGLRVAVVLRDGSGNRRALRSDVAVPPTRRSVPARG